MSVLGEVVSFDVDASTYSVPYLLEVFPELDFILGSSYNVLRSVTKSWVIKFSWFTSGARTKVEHLTPIRALGYPGFFR